MMKQCLDEVFSFGREEEDPGEKLEKTLPPTEKSSLDDDEENFHPNVPKTT